jgi:hypothetical protein
MINSGTVFLLFTARMVRLRIAGVSITLYELRSTRTQCTHQIAEPDYV